MAEMRNTDPLCKYPDSNFKHELFVEYGSGKPIKFYIALALLNFFQVQNRKSNFSHMVSVEPIRTL